jgi:hypothetical protein
LIFKIENIFTRDFFCKQGKLPMKNLMKTIRQDILEIASEIISTNKFLSLFLLAQGFLVSTTGAPE